MSAKTDDPVVTQSILDKTLDERLEKLRKEIVDDISDVISQFAQQVDSRFNKVESEIRQLNEKYDHLITTLDNFIKRLDDVETDNAARDAHIARLERRVERIEAETGIKL